ncbi:hypothetical protein VA7868_02494 [Vibrio aerogenes CECT 7868]|uniref:Uncharacterized protein n=1 Tax=Vibrio aerogenes CECT 7868 TaxID=1216006 RepID=A0A1M5ZAH8_9VIBR|nr:hypothetical protein VA7868_02494 [Vibrio aerogenes CECT 7868]
MLADVKLRKTVYQIENRVEAQGKRPCLPDHSQTFKP